MSDKLLYVNINTTDIGDVILSCDHPYHMIDGKSEDFDGFNPYGYTHNLARFVDAALVHNNKYHKEL